MLRSRSRFPWARFVHGFRELELDLGNPKGGADTYGKTIRPLLARRRSDMDDEAIFFPERELPRERLERRREHLVHEIARPAPRRPTRRFALALAAFGLVAVLSGVGAYAIAREPTHVDSIGCYDRAELGASVSVIGSTAVDPVTACAELWRAGQVSSTTDVPPLTPCVLDSGAVAVLPGRAGICEGLGIASLSREARVRFAQLGALHEALRERLGAGSGTDPRGSCVGEAEARRIVAAELSARGYADWRVEVALPFDAERRCASAYLEPERRTVELLPVWP